jgi:hypothetical protein
MNDIIIKNEIKNNITNNKNDILIELIKNQLNNIELEKKLSLLDIKRIVNNIPNSIFSDSCCIWSGYIINSKKTSYISFYIKNKKIALHRLLYCNFVGHLYDNEYVKFTCENKGICCSIKHLKKVDNDKLNETNTTEIVKKQTNNTVFFINETN